MTFTCKTKLLPMKRYTVILIALALALTGCTEMEVSSARGGAITVRPALGAVTKAALTTIPTSRTLHVSAWYNAAEGTSCNYFGFTPFTYSASAGGWQAEARYWPQRGTVDFLAYSTGALTPTAVMPSDNVSEAVSLVLPSNAADQEDILAGGASGAFGSAPMAMVHAQALLTFRIASDKAYDASGNRGFTLKKIVLEGAAFAGTLKVSRSGGAVTCTWSDLGGTQDMTVYSGTKNVTETANEVGSSILVPAQGACAVTLTYVMHNGPAGDLEVEHTFTPEAVWAAGRHYTYDITLTAQKVIVTSTLKGFDDDDLPSGIDIEPYRTVTVPEVM